MEARKVTSKVTPGLDEQFVTGRLYGTQINKILSPAQCGTAYLNKYSLVFCSLHFFKTWPKWSMRWLHFRRQRT